MKGIILAGVRDRSSPRSKVTDKHLLPVGKASHYHELQTDCFVSVRGMIELYDERDGSPTKGIVNEFFLGEHNEQLADPPDGWHGLKNICEVLAIFVNVTTHPPDECRLPAHENHISYE